MKFFTSSSAKIITENNVAYNTQIQKQRMPFLHNFLVQFKSVTQLHTKLMHVAHCYSDFIPLSFKYIMYIVQNWCVHAIHIQSQFSDILILKSAKLRTG